MYSNRNLKIVLAIIAALLIVLALILVVYKKDDNGSSDKTNNKVPTPNEILYRIEFDKKTGFSIESVRAHLATNENYIGYTTKDEYFMVYQITGAQDAKNVSQILGIDVSVLPEVDYANDFIMISTGRELVDINDKLNIFDEKGNRIVEYIYSDAPYEKEQAYIYTMNTKKFSSGDDYEDYLWQTADKKSNLIYDKTSERTVVSEGKYHSLYIREDNKYIYRLMDSTGEKAIKNVVSDTEVKITELSDTMVKIENNEKTVYYNPAKIQYSEEYSVPTGYLIYNIIFYMRVNNGKIQLILRDAYDQTFYAKIIELPFTNNKDDIHSLVKSVTVIDDTNVMVEYYKGDNRALVKESVEVYNLKR